MTSRPDTSKALAGELGPENGSGVHAERKSGRKIPKGSAIQRVLDIIELVSKSERPLTPTELSVMLEIPKASVHRMCSSLVSQGFVQSSLNGRGLLPGSRLNQIALGVLASSPMRAERRAILTSLSNEIGETCNISIPDGSEMIYFDRAETHWPVRIQLQVGSRVPVHCTSAGKMYLSSLASTRRKRVLRNSPLTAFTNNTIVDTKKIQAELELTRERGYAIDDEEYVEGMVAMAVAVQDSSGRLYATLSFHAPVMRISVDQVEKYLGSLQQSARQLSELLEE